jgi:RNA-splicing ligase RtcB
MFEIKGKYTTATVYAEEIDEACVAQITQLVNNLAFTYPIAIQPDCHAGKGSVIGFTMRMTDKVIPNIIGLDIGCGLFSVKLDLGVNDINRERLDEQIRSTVPFGMNVHSKPVYTHDTDKFYNLCKKIGIDPFYANASLGTLGGGEMMVATVSVNN